MYLNIKLDLKQICRQINALTDLYIKTDMHKKIDSLYRQIDFKYIYIDRKVDRWMS